jgi:hypothetical protein
MTMARVPMSHRGKRPRFFPSTGMDEMVSMMIELTAEVWVLKKRLYLLERVAGDKGLDLTSGIEGYALSPGEVDELAAERKKMIANVLRALEAEFGQPDDGAADQEAPSPAPSSGQTVRPHAA